MQRGEQQSFNFWHYLWQIGGLAWYEGRTTFDSQGSKHFRFAGLKHKTQLLFMTIFGGEWRVPVVHFQNDDKIHFGQKCTFRAAFQRGYILNDNEKHLLVINFLPDAPIKQSWTQDAKLVFHCRIHMGMLKTAEASPPWDSPAWVSRSLNSHGT